MGTCTTWFLRCPGLRKFYFLNLHKCTYLVNESDCSDLKTINQSITLLITEYKITSVAINREENHNFL